MASEASGSATLLLRSRLHDTILRAKIPAVEALTSGDIQAVIIEETAHLNHFFAHALPFVIINGVIALGALGIIVLHAPLLALLVLAPLAVFIAIVPRFQHTVVSLFVERGRCTATLAGVVGESTRGLRSIRAMAAEEYRQKLLTDTVERLRVVQARINWVLGGMVMYWPP
jgi:ABC-type bacteriocin/lantibiotic exporter with double-glycine peptidase domain